MKPIKRFLWAVATGGLIGAIASTWFSPGLIAWYFSPPAELAFTCQSAVDWAIFTYRKVIFTGVMLGGITSAILFFALGGHKRAPGAPKNLGAAGPTDAGAAGAKHP